MKVAAASVHPYRLPLRSPWLTAGASVGERCGWLLCLQDDSGRRGYGDCAPLPGSGGENAPAAAQALRSLLPPLIGLTAPAALERLDPHGDCPTPVARCAVETALLDLLAQGSGMPLAVYLGGTRQRHEMGSAPPPPVRISAACGSLRNLRATDVRAACNAGFAILKLKVGVLTIDDEVARLQRVATVLPPGCRLRLDANRAWSDAAAARFLQDCANLPIEMLEEPLAAPDIDRLQALQDSTAIAIAVDESIGHLDSESLVERRAVRRLVIKPPRHGGLLPAFALARHASHAGVECIITSSLDSACGITAAAHVAAALDNGLAHGLATSTWLQEDTGSPPRIGRGLLLLDASEGLGFVPDAQRRFLPIERLYCR
ncbi:o-succinylbenzoate synthase [Accumulibacter sp.]|uniref:o-succinylbenzoate synthase n=1 Tax=Accumulibacter sp. TaxID=2053492 RepID=UPI0025D5B275|nr:o-succinylbenzoate synthase [Accumulibacter sp.]MCM8612171.1 o-succinylbenzoate synthase [Accumulibacter sp.]MCM8636046.1 o-succinylbenzoate synthase [Accumulibacter sp.]MCM8640029.1 o-succinylbenzoate synthase [Accumulibacter sp.]